MNLNTKQVISIVGAILSVLMISTAQLTDLFGAGTAKSIVSVAGLGNLILQSIMTALTSQSSTIREVLAMPGVDKVNVNAAANQTLAAIAVDRSIDKIGPTPGSAQQVEATAKGT